MRIAITTAVLFVNLILQSTILQYIQIRGIVPNTAIIVIVSWALLRGQFFGAAVGFGVGLLQDIFFGNGIGYYALMGLITGYVCGRSHQSFYRENYILPLILCASATVLYETAVYVTGFLFNNRLNFGYYFTSLIIPEAVYTAVVSILIYKLLFEINKFIEDHEKFKRKLF